MFPFKSTFLLLSGLDCFLRFYIGNLLLFSTFYYMRHFDLIQLDLIQFHFVTSSPVFFQPSRKSVLNNSSCHQAAECGLFGIFGNSSGLQ